MARFTSLSLPAFIVLGALASGCSEPEAPGGSIDPRVLYGFEGCDDLLGYTKEQAKDLIDQYGNLYGYDYSQGWFWGEGDAGFDTSGGGTSGGEGDSGGDGGQPPGDGQGGGGDKDYSGTNVQEAGVDEADIVKTDGERILALARGSLHFVDVSGASPKLRGSLALGVDAYDAQMFLHEDRALVLLRTYPYYYGDGQPAPADAIDLQQYFGPEFWGSVLRIVEVDLSDPDHLKVVRNLHVTGDLVSARLVGGVARVVLRSSYTGQAIKDPSEFFDWAAYEVEAGIGGYSEAIYQKYWDLALAQSKVFNKAIIDASTPEDWLPRYVLEDKSQGAPKLSEGLLVDCADVKHSGVYSGLSVLSVMSVDLSAGMSLGESVGVFSEGETVYASQESLYVAMTPWSPADWGLQQEEPQGKTTFVHKFDITARERAEYVASGSVRGWLLSQWALSERGGDLRVASTDSLGWDNTTSESFVSVLRQEGDELVQIGQVGGLGKTEQIQGVRFIGDVGYVVTFRQTDPLYTVDVSDPTKPAVVGELKIPGFSAYLHPVGEDLILGVGRDGTEEGQILGMQLSLFDVSDLAAPKQIHKATLGSDWGWSEALFDHKAFLWWAKTGLTMLPIEWSSYDDVNGYVWEQGAFGFHVDAESGIQLVGEVQHPTPENGGCVDEFECWYWSPALRRSLVVGDLVYTVSDVGLKANALDGLAEKHWVEFPQ